MSNNDTIMTYTEQQLAALLSIRGRKKSGLPVQIHRDKTKYHRPTLKNIPEDSE